MSDLVTLGPAETVDTTTRKFHASLNVSDLARSIEFYRVLLGSEPAKRRADYAKFELPEPPLVLSLIPGRSGGGGALNHFGLRVGTTGDLVAIQARLESAGITTEREDGVECCYARQTKFWVTDPDRTLWEIYVFHEDIEERGNARPPGVTEERAPSGASTPRREWEHRLTEPLPARLPHDDNSLHAARLEGTINLEPDRARLPELFAELLRVLVPGGTLGIHGLAADRAVTAPIALPGPAALVRHTPTPAAVMEEMRAQGFVEIEIEKLSEKPCFEVEGIPLRELQVTGRKSGHRPKRTTHTAVYLGPLAHVADDFGNVFRRGEATPLNIHDWQALGRSAAAGQFLLLTPEAASPRSASCSPI